MSKRRLEQDWSKCLICQEDKNEKLECPAKTKRTAEKGKGYVTFVENIKTHNTLVSEHERFDVTQIGIDVGDMIGSLTQNCASWHKSCRSRFTSTKLQRLQKKKEQEVRAGPSCMTTHDASDISQVQSRRQSSRQPPYDTLEQNRKTCMFCKSCEGGTLHAVSTKEMDMKIRTTVEMLEDNDLIAFVSDGDLIAQEAHYHKLCYTRFCNRTRLLYEYKHDDGELEDPDIDDSSLAFAQVVSYLEDNPDVVHKLSDVVKMYKKQCKERGLKDVSVHPTRFKDRLLRVISDLDTYPSGKETLLSFNKNISELLGKSRLESADDEAVALWRVAKTIRRDCDNLQIQESLFSIGNQEKSVPKSLLSLIKMLLLGSSSIEGTSTRHQESLSLSQLLVTNSVQRKGRQHSGKRLVAARETPLPLYVGLFIYNNTRSRKLIDTLFALGLSVSYSRVLSVASEISKAVERQFEDDGIVCPVDLRHDLFTTAAVDNIDHNPTSNTSRKAFHGTAISLFQHPQTAEDGRDRSCLSQSCISDDFTVLNDFTAVEEDVPFGNKPVLPILDCDVDLSSNGQYLQVSLNEEDNWLHLIASSDQETLEIQTWPSFHAQQLAPVHQPPSINTILPLLDNHANKISTIKHVMDKVASILHFLNPEQTPVLVADQPLFALAKQIQWKWPELYGEGKYVIFMGGLHIEMEFLKTLGTFLSGTGWTYALTKAGICGSGTADSFLKASHVKRTRYAHQVTAACLAILQQEALSSFSEESNTNITMEDWCNNTSPKSNQFFYWDLVLKLEKLTFCLIKSMRKSDFNSYIEVLKEFLPFLFILDKTNYARWLSVHIRDMLALPFTSPEVFDQFNRGHFTVRKSGKAFSTMSIDQAHEQNNEKLKGSLHLISLMESPAALQRWILASPHLSTMLKDFESCIPGMKERRNDRHADDTVTKQRIFSKDVKNLVEVFQALGNPFLETSGIAITNLETGDTAGPEIHDNIRKLEGTGKVLCNEFVEMRFRQRELMVTDPIKKNNVNLMSSLHPKRARNKSAKLMEIKNTCGLFSQLYVACQRRGSDLDEFFSHENSTYPPALTREGQLRTCDNKAELLPFLITESAVGETPRLPPSSCIIYDGAAMVHLSKPSGLMSFSDYAENVFLKRLMNVGQHVTRIDLVFDEYHRQSIKASTRLRRGVAGARKVVPSMFVPRNWSEFLKNEQNKSALFGLLAKIFVENKSEKCVTVTIGPNVLTNSTLSLDNLSPCHQEEADTRIFLHAADAVKNGHDCITIRSVDTDVVVLATALYNVIGAGQMWIAFGTGNNFKYIPIHEVAHGLGPQKSRALLFFHAFTGCDSVSSFNGIGKKKAWTAWAAFPHITEIFVTLADFPQQVSPHHRQLLEQFTAFMYKASECTNVNSARRMLFAKKGRSIERIPPTSNALLQHIKRATYQAGYVWASAIHRDMEVPSPLEWGWTTDGTHLRPFWTDLPEASKVCQELIKCMCKTACSSSRCKCARNELPCTDLCRCGGSCRT